MPSKKVLLNVGSGHRVRNAGIPSAFMGPDWKELRLDIDPENDPDIIGSVLDMGAVKKSSIDAIYSSHVIEHLYPNEIPDSISEMLRVLKPSGYAVITCPDLQSAALMIAEDRLHDVAYVSPAGPVTPFDIVYSHRMFTRRDNPFMAHHSGFTLKSLVGLLKANGFRSVMGKRRLRDFDLWVVAAKGVMADDDLRRIAIDAFPP